MSKFQQKFILSCLEKINHIISNKEEREAAALIFTQGKHLDVGHKTHSRISDISHWSEEDITLFCAAVFTATASTTFEFCKNQNLDKEISQATELLLNKYIPLITKDTQTGQRLKGVEEHIAKQSAQIKHELKTIENPYCFFSQIAVGLGLVTAGIYALTK